MTAPEQAYHRARSLAGELEADLDAITQAAAQLDASPATWRAFAQLLQRNAMRANQIAESLAVLRRDLPETSRG